MSAPPFIVALTGDFYDSGGTSKFSDLGLSMFSEHPNIVHRVFQEQREEIDPEQIGDAQGVIVLTPKVTGKTVSNSDKLLAIARFGVGYDAVDVKACTNAGVLATITTGAVNWSVAEATVGWMLALSHNVRTKDQLLRSGNWDERSRHMGCELRDRTLGLIGLGGIARTVIELLRNFNMKRPLAYDPWVSEAIAAEQGVQLVALDEVLKRADFVSIHCPLTDSTRGLIGTRELSLMRSSAFLLNTARGGIVDEPALYDALKNRQIAGAAIDCFDKEPVTAPPRFAELDNVILAPHCIAWTNELFRDIGRSACQVMVDLSMGVQPQGVLNSELFGRSSFLRKWERAIGRSL